MAGDAAGYPSGKAGPPGIDTEAVAVLDGADDFEDIIDSPYGAEHDRLLAEEGENPDAAEAEFVIEKSSKEDEQFDCTVGILQEIAISESFQSLLNEFCAAQCHHFEDTEENKLVYTDIFKQYSDLIEGYLGEALKERIPGFEMESFLEELTKRGEDAIDPEMLDLLVSLADFEAFKAQMLATKSGHKLDLSIAGVASTIHRDEVEDGEVRPDLADALLVTPASPSGKR